MRRRLVPPLSPPLVRHRFPLFPKTDLARHLRRRLISPISLALLRHRPTPFPKRTIRGTCTGAPYHPIFTTSAPSNPHPPNPPRFPKLARRAPMRRRLISLLSLPLVRHRHPVFQNGPLAELALAPRIPLSLPLVRHRPTVLQNGPFAALVPAPRTFPIPTNRAPSTPRFPKRT